MLITYFSPLLVYTAPPFAGILLIVIVNEIGYRWALGTYVAISLLSVFLIADKESAVYFTMFFGYYPILKLLMENPGNVFTTAQIYRAVWREEPIGADGTVAVHVRHLREKLEADPSNPRYIKVVWGKGYRLEDKL